MPIVKKESSIKDQELKVKSSDTSLRAPKGRGNLPRKIARSPRSEAGLAVRLGSTSSRREKRASSRTPQSDKKETASGKLAVPVYSLAGRQTGTLALPKEIFGQEVNKQLLSQAIRVYSTNQKSLTGSTKTRGEVEGSTVKIYRQKGTGRARHGAIRAPIFVGGGIVFGPKPRRIRLSLPQKMKKAALFAALSAKLADKQVIGLSGLGKATGKTKQIAKLLEKLNIKSALIITGARADNALKAARNIPGVEVLPVNLLNAYVLLKHQMLLLSEEAAEKLK